jgi:hypothetical protein
LLSTDQVIELRRHCRRLGQPWTVWARVTLDGLETVRETLHRSDDALLDAWQSLARVSIETALVRGLQTSLSAAWRSDE